MSLHPTAGRALVAAVLAVSLGAPGEVSAQRAALVQDVDNAARTPYQQEAYCYLAGSGNTCQIKYQAVPPGKRREIRLVSCSAQTQPTSQALLFQSVSLYTTLPPRVSITLPFQSQLPGAPYNGLVYAQTSMFFEATDTPTIQVSIFGFLGAADCTLIGNDITL